MNYCYWVGYKYPWSEKRYVVGFDDRDLADKLVTEFKAKGMQAAVTTNHPGF